MSAEAVRAAREQLEQAVTSLRCSDLVRILRKLGFDVRDGAKQGHKVMTHPGVPSFTSQAFTCGHGKNPEIKPVYVRNIVATLRQFESELAEYLRALQ
ncbi:type II toxin-antitoxin system HicA family toxin [uncultured Thiohalocapsa sp.]|uniref:type II toxin-antitoxin system HicA family toxin n=1 Tax=uncultured Thiohalocapsa sp. TaxID=768990 RepID=UPI0025F87BF3|nr:type II toxin-antitoxin system HicA family toxin [uncultured Thiohalocapsa sp.]